MQKFRFYNFLDVHLFLSSLFISAQWHIIHVHLKLPLPFIWTLNMYWFPLIYECGYFSSVTKPPINVPKVHRFTSFNAFCLFHYLIPFLVPANMLFVRCIAKAMAITIPNDIELNQNHKNSNANWFLAHFVAHPMLNVYSVRSFLIVLKWKCMFHE